MRSLKQHIAAGIGRLDQVVGQGPFLGRELGPDVYGAALCTRMVFGVAAAYVSSWPSTLETDPRMNESSRSIEMRILLSCEDVRPSRKSGNSFRPPQSPLTCALEADEPGQAGQDEGRGFGDGSDTLHDEVKEIRCRM